MPFNQRRLSVIETQSRDIPSYFAYATNDTLAAVRANGYFAASRFVASNPVMWFGGRISVAASDGYTEGFISSDSSLINEYIGGGGQADTIVGGTNITVDSTDPENPIVNGDADVTLTSITPTAGGNLSVNTNGIDSFFVGESSSNGAQFGGVGLSGAYTSGNFVSTLSFGVATDNSTLLLACGNGTDSFNLQATANAEGTTSVLGNSLASNITFQPTGNIEINTRPNQFLVNDVEPGQVGSIVAGTNISVDNSDPANPIISSSTTPLLTGFATGDVPIVLSDGTLGASDLRYDEDTGRFITDSSFQISPSTLFLGPSQSLGSSIHTANFTTGLGADLLLSGQVYDPVNGISKLQVRQTGAPQNTLLAANQSQVLEPPQELKFDEAEGASLNFLVGVIPTTTGTLTIDIYLTDRDVDHADPQIDPLVTTLTKVIATADLNTVVTVPYEQPGITSLGDKYTLSFSGVSLKGGTQTGEFLTDQTAPYFEASFHVDTPVNVLDETDIIDSYASTSTTDVLSANRGRLLDGRLTTAENKLSDIDDNATANFVGSLLTSHELTVTSSIDGSGQVEIITSNAPTSLVFSVPSSSGSLIITATDYIQILAGSGLDNEGSELVRVNISSFSSAVVGDPFDPDYLIITATGDIEKGFDTSGDVFSPIALGAVGQKATFNFLRSRDLLRVPNAAHSIASTSDYDYLAANQAPVLNTLIEDKRHVYTVWVGGDGTPTTVANVRSGSVGAFPALEKSDGNAVTNTATYDSATSAVKLTENSASNHGVLGFDSNPYGLGVKLFMSFSITPHNNNVNGIADGIHLFFNCDAYPYRLYSDSADYNGIIVGVDTFNNRFELFLGDSDTPYTAVASENFTSPYTKAYFADGNQHTLTAYVYDRYLEILIDSDTTPVLTYSRTDNFPVGGSLAGVMAFTGDSFSEQYVHSFVHGQLSTG